jgi:hypothetical protein
LASSLLASNPGNLFVVAYHPTNSSFTTTDPMRRDFPNAFYTTPFVGNSRYMPSAMIARRIWGGGERIQGTGSWTGDVDVIKVESSPLNMGVSSTYNSSNSALTVNIEVYFTANVTAPVTLYAMLIENGIIAYQNGGGSNYIHLHAFREAFPKPTPTQWGETIAAPTTQGTVKTYTYTFDNSTAAYVMANCEIVVFIRNASNEEIISGNGAPVGSQSPVEISNTSTATDNYSVFPNPMTDNSMLSISVSTSSEFSYTVYDVSGKVIETKNLGILNAGIHQIDLNTSMLDKGMYFVKINNGTNTQTIKVIK